MTGSAVAVGLAIGAIAGVSTAAAATPQWIYVVFKGSGSGFASHVTAGGGRADLTASWTFVYRIAEAFPSGCLSGTCGAPWQQHASGTGSITGSSSPEENCTGSVTSNAENLQIHLNGDHIQFTTNSPMEYGGGIQLTNYNCPVSGGYFLEGTGLAQTRPESLKFIRSTFGVPLVTHVSGGPGPAPSFNPQSVSWSGTITIINGTCGNVCSAPGPSTPEAVRDFARNVWRSLLPEYLAVFVYESVTISSLDLNEIFSELHVPTSVFDAQSQALRQYVVGSNVFYKLYFLPIVNETFTSMINTLTALEKAFNDPPLPGYRRPAPVASLGAAPRFPSCNVAPRGARPFCRRLVASAAGWLARLHRTESLTNALAIDVGRESGADNAANSRAALRLASAELGLLPRIRAAISHQRAAGRQLANALRTIKFDPRLDATQVNAALPQVLADLATRGVSASDIGSILGGPSIPPRALDLDKLLAASWF